MEAWNATIFRFNKQEDAKEVYDKLNQVDHPCVIKALGLANGVGKYINYTFFALTLFDTTLATYTEKHIGSDQVCLLYCQNVLVVDFMFYFKKFKNDLFGQ